MAEAKKNKVTVYIDGAPYEIKPGVTPVAKLRELRNPPVPRGKEIWLDILDEQDELLDDAGSLDITDGMRFFTEIDAITIRIDRVEYEVYKRRMTGAELRTLPSPDVPADRDLWRDVPDHRDVKVQDEDVVRLHDGTRFFTAPGRINPGSRK
ncbi:MAG: multiubiquitin domain-containing protein [Actinomycetales bacterium]|nr:multiubiquitin domain-containing protein [Actinomycetales bacterium]